MDQGQYKKLMNLILIDLFLQKIKFLVEQNTYPRDISAILNSITNYENIPRKRPKFINFIKNSCRIRNENLINKVWDIFEESIKNNKPSNNNSVSEKKENNQTQQQVSNLIDDQNKELNENIQENTADTKLNLIPEKLKMKKVITEILSKYNSMTKNKLKKKVLKRYRNQGYEDEMKIVNKFEKIILKNKFINNNNVITLNQ